MKLKLNETLLPNGIRVISSEIPHVESIAVGIWVGVGGRYESLAASGSSHFIEHLLFKGTRKRSARDISQAIEGKGGYFNAFTQEESTCYYARITSDYAADVVDILSDMYRNPLFDRDEMDKERGVIIEEIMMYRDQPQHLVQDCLGELLWVNHPLGRPLIGTPRNINRVTREEIMAFKRKKYVPANTVLAFAGRLEHDRCVGYANRYFGKMAKTPRPVYRKVARSTPQAPICMLRKRVEQSHVALGVRLFGRHDRRRFALKLLSVMLGENMSSRLFQVVRERNGLAYSIHSSTHLFNETGALVISAGLDRKRTNRAIGLIMKELVRLRDRRVSHAELRRAKDYAIGQLRISMESTITQMVWIGENLLGFDRLVQPEEAIRLIERVSVDDIQKVAGQVLKRNNMSVSLVVPEDQPDTEEQVLAQLDR